MIAIGIVRRLDSVGRITLPKKLLSYLKINTHERLEIISDGDSIILQKYKPTCVFCGGSEKVASVKGRKVCASCLAAMAKIMA